MDDNQEDDEASLSSQAFRGFDDEEDEFSDSLFSFPDSSNNHEPQSDFQDRLHDFDAWQDTPFNQCIVSFDGARRSAWETGKYEIHDICKNIISSATVGGRDEQFRSQEDVISDVDCVNLYFGPNSPIFGVFTQTVKWDYTKFCRFIITTMRMCSMNASITRLHGMGGKIGEKELLMDETEYTECWNIIDSIGEHQGQANSANAPTPFWRLSMNAFNEVSVKLSVTGRTEDQLYTVDNDKTHFESPPKGFKNSLLKCVKFTRDNRWGSNLHTMATPATMFVSCAVWEERGDTTESCTERLLFETAFGGNAKRKPDLSNIELSFDRGYQSLNLISTLLSQGAIIHSTCKRQPWVPLTYDQHLRKEDKRELVPMQGIPMLKNKTITLGITGTQSLSGVKLSISAYRNGMNSVCLTMSSKIHDYRYDYVTSNVKESRLYSARNYEALQKIGFKCSPGTMSLHYYELFKTLPVQMVTLDQSNKVWVFARGLGFTSSTINPVIGILYQHRTELTDLAGLNLLLRFARKGFLENENRETDDEMDGTDQIENDGNGNNGGILLDENNDGGGTEMEEERALSRGVIEGDHVHNAKLDFLRVTRSIETVETIIEKVGECHTEYLAEFLKLAGLSSIPTSAQSMRKRVLEWCNAPQERREYELKTKAELTEAYARKFDKLASASWTKTVLIQKLRGNPNDERGKNRDYKQKLLDEIVRYSFGMRPLKGKAQEACALGHYGETSMSRLLMKLSNERRFPYGVIEEIIRIGLVRHKNLITCQDSVDRLIGVRKGDGTWNLYLVEFKTRTTADGISAEYERINRHHPDRSMYATVKSDSPVIHKLIPCNKERMQLLHHCYTYGKNDIFHIVGSTNKILSCIKVTFSSDLIYSYGQALKRIHDDVLDCFYSHDLEEGFDHLSEEEHERLKLAIISNDKAIPDLDSFLSRLMLLRETTHSDRLPLPSCQQLIPEHCSTWNARKFASDIVTQMMWNIMPSLPVNTIQTSAVRKTSILLPTYNIHRARQIVSAKKDLKQHKTIKQYRDAANQRFSLYETVNMIEDVLKSNFVRFTSIPPSPPPINRMRTEIVRSLHGIRNVKIVREIMSPVTGNTPKRNVEKYYRTHDGNMHNDVVKRRKKCMGNPVGIPIEREKRGTKCQVCRLQTARIRCLECHGVFCDLSLPHNSMNNNCKTFAFPVSESIERKGESKDDFVFGVV